MGNVDGRDTSSIFPLDEPRKNQDDDAMGLRASKIAAPQPEGAPRFWYRDNFFVTTDKSYLRADDVNKVFASDLMWWNEALEPAQMDKMLKNCLTLSIWWVPESAEDMQKHGAPRRKARRWSTSGRTCEA